MLTVGALACICPRGRVAHQFSNANVMQEDFETAALRNRVVQIDEKVALGQRCWNWVHAVQLVPGIHEDIDLGLYKTAHVHQL